MILVFTKVTKINCYILNILYYFSFNLAYIEIKSQSFLEKKKIFLSLKKKKIYQINNSFFKQKSLHEFYKDTDSTVKKKTNQILNSNVTRKFLLRLKSKIKNNDKNLKLLVQHQVANCYMNYSFYMSIFSKIYKNKIILLSFDWQDFFIPNITNVTKVILPLNLFNILFKKKTSHKRIERNSEKQNINYDAKVGYIIHESFSYGKLYEKDNYYSSDNNSNFNSKNIIHFFYSNKNPNNSVYINVDKILGRLKIIKIYLNYIVNIRNINDFLYAFYFANEEIKFYGFINFFKKFKNLKIILIDFDLLCPKSILLALTSSNIKIVSLQERSISKYNLPTYTFFCDYLLADSNYLKKNTNYNYTYKNYITVGYPRADLVRNKIQDRTSKTILCLGLSPSDILSKDIIHPLTNFYFQKFFINEIIRLASEFKSYKFVIRYKYSDWLKNNFFSKSLKQIKNTENLSIDFNTHDKNLTTYIKCIKSDLIISCYSTIVEEMVFIKKPVFVFDYTEYLNSCFKNIVDKNLRFLFCNSYEELRSKINFYTEETSQFYDKLNFINSKMLFPKKEINSRRLIQSSLENILKSI